MILAIKTEKIGNLVLNLATRCQQPYILVEGESFHWTNCILTDFEVPDEIILIKRLGTLWIQMEDKHFLTEFWWKKNLDSLAFFSTLDLSLTSYCTFIFADDMVQKDDMMIMKRGCCCCCWVCRKKFYKRRWLPFGIHMKRIIGLGTLLLCRLFRIINMAADSLRTTTNSMFELFINFQHSSISRSRRK